MRQLALGIWMAVFSSFACGGSSQGPGSPVNPDDGKGGLVFNKIAAPADGMYDVTWYYHCGKNDNFGDGNCGGEPNHPAGGCRPHILTVNGTRLPKVYEFHCFPGPWGEIHLVTTPLPLKEIGRAHV